MGIFIKHTFKYYNYLSYFYLIVNSAFKVFIMLIKVKMLGLYVVTLVVPSEQFCGPFARFCGFYGLQESLSMTCLA